MVSNVIGHRQAVVKIQAKPVRQNGAEGVEGMERKILPKTYCVLAVVTHGLGKTLDYRGTLSSSHKNTI